MSGAKFWSRLLSRFISLSLLSMRLWGQIPASSANSPVAQVKLLSSRVCAKCIRANEEFLASDAMRGRGSATQDEWVAATYVAAMLRSYGLEPAGDDGGYIQRAVVVCRKLTAAPEMSAAGAASGSPWRYGRDFLVQHLSQTNFSGPLRKVDADQFSDEEAAQIAEGSVVLVAGKDSKRIRKLSFSLVTGGAAAVVVASPATPERFESLGRELPKLADRLEGDSKGIIGEVNLLNFKGAAFEELQKLEDGTVLHFAASAETKKGSTWNAIGKLKGSDPKLGKAAILLSAHLDHLGVGEAVKGDDIYNGADDDASGTAAVLELARVLGAEARPRRTVVFALFGSEETGGLGSTYFREHPPLPLKDFAANLEFEMIGRSDATVQADTLWLTGWERSNLGSTLAAHGARLVADPHPSEQFFTRSDNYVLAKKGVVAQTVSSYGLHKDYHQPSDDLAHLDFKHMNAAIGSLLGPVRWLVNSDFKPQWNKGGQP